RRDRAAPLIEVTVRIRLRRNGDWSEGIQRIDRTTHVLEFDLAVVRGGDAHARAGNDLGGHVGEAGAPVHAALERHVALLQRIDAGRQQAVDVEGFLVARDDDDLHLAGIEHHGQPGVVAYAAVHGPAVQVYAVEHQLDPAGDGQRFAWLLERRHGHLAAQRQGEFGAHARRGGLLRRLRIAQGVEGDVLQALAQDLGQHGGRVHGAAGAGVVEVVEQDDGTLLDGLGARDGGRQRFAVEDPLFAAVPGGLQ